jgi:hypothetical protein
MAASAGSPAMTSALLSGAHAADLHAKACQQDYLDPLDTNYTALAQADPPTVIGLAAGSGITQAESTAYNLWLTNLALIAGYSTALTTSINRAQGAVAWLTAVSPGILCK